MTNDLHQLAGAYALDALDGDERAAFEAHLRGCAECRKEVAEFVETTGVVADAERVAPPESLRERVLAEVATTRQVPPRVPDAAIDLAERRRRGDRRPRVLAAAAAVMVSVVATVAVLQFVGDEDGNTPVELVQDAPDAVVTDLDGEQGTLRVVWSAERAEVAVIGEGLTDPSSDETYALWSVGVGGVAPAGLFTSDGGEVSLVLDVSDVATDSGIGWGVSIEPAGGSPQPTEVLYVGVF